MCFKIIKYVILFPFISVVLACSLALCLIIFPFRGLYNFVTAEGFADFKAKMKAMFTEECRCNEYTLVIECIWWFISYKFNQRNPEMETQIEKDTRLYYKL